MWNYSQETGDPLPIANEGHLWQPDGEDKPGSISPMYDHLETNIPRSMMQYSDFSFPDDAQLFPQREVVMRYLQAYAEEVRHLIRFSVEVLDVRHEVNGEHDRWKVTVKEMGTKCGTEEIYDAIVVASGHYDVPYMPEILGLSAWAAKYPGTVMHSKAYRSPETFRDK